MKSFASIFILALLPALSTAEPGYGHLWWANGFRGEPRVLHVQTDHYGAVFDTERGAITRLGPIANPVSYADAAEQSNAILDNLPAAALDVALTVDGVTYTCTRAAQRLDDHINYPVRLIDGGRFLNRFDIFGLEFTNADDVLPVEGRLEVSAWTDRLHLALYLTSDTPPALATLRVTRSASGYETEDEITCEGWSADAPPVFVSAWPSDDEDTNAIEIAVRDEQADDALIPVTYMEKLGAYYVHLPARSWDMGENLDRLDRFSVSLSNASDAGKTAHVIFGIDGPFQGATGMSAILRGTNGSPTGHPVQVSKNWHRREEIRLLYEGPWFHGATEFELPAGETWDGELALVYARWGGVPAASHGQLSLIGWGGNQRWDQAAIGSFGESITYDPDVGLNRAVIDDVRPLMVTGMNGDQWTWTHNVGGGDFLVYFNADREKQFLSRMKTAYLSQGPNLTDVIYAGESADGKIAARLQVQTPRTDDISRAYHRFRYDVREPVAFSRLAFYQLGADNYNDHVFTTIARGNKDGLIEEWETERGGKTYLRDATPCEGDIPWVALLGGIRTEEKWQIGAWADRAIVVRHWKARLGGQDVPLPHIAVYGTENGPHSANAELAPPPGLTQLQRGDFVEADIELLIPPQHADDYYGPNDALRADLAENGGTWKAVHRLAVANDLAIAMETGALLRDLPIEIACDNDRAAFTVTGGAGFVPITFTGVTKPSGYALTVNGTPLDQSVHGNDFWQTIPDGNTYRITYNLPLHGEPRTRQITFGPTPG